MTLQESKKWIEREIEIVDYNTTYIDEMVEIGSGTIIYPNVSIRGKSIIGKNNIIDSNTVIINTIIGNNNKVLSSYLDDVKIGDENAIGPFSHLRNKVVIGDKNRIGNYVEIKDSFIGNNNSFSHLSYIGNSEIGNGINFSAGAITANYDLINKEYKKTIIKDDVVVGANSVLVAPVKLEKKSFIAAGSVINRDVEERDLAIARKRQEIKKNYVEEG